MDHITENCLDLQTEKGCVEYLFQLKWPYGFSCPECNHWEAYTIRTRNLPLYECKECKHQTSLLAGTVMEGTRTPLSKWLHAIALVANPEHGISALSLSRIIAVSYKTAWSMLHKIRFAMGKADTSERLTGHVIVHDACYGRPHNPTLYRHPQETPVLVGASLVADQPSRILITMVPTDQLQDQRILPIAAHSFKEHYVSKVHSSFEIHIRKFSPRQTKKAFPLFREACHWINQTFHGLGKKHLQRYLNEFCCRTNLILSAATSIFEEISRFCMSFGTITYSSIIQKKPVT